MGWWNKGAVGQSGGASQPRREFGADVEVAVLAPSILEFQIALAEQSGANVTETLTFEMNGKTVEPELIVGELGTRIHRLTADEGTVTATYRATAVGLSDPSPVNSLDLATYLRPSRYAESDKFFGFAATEFGQYADSVTVLEKVSSWVGTRLSYVPGSSDPIDGAVDTLLAGRGVCRDYAHLVVALLRAVKVPARLVSVYAPGCDPMDFHAVAEALVDGAWRVVDATCLAPRQSMMRIATGRDAADTAWLDNHGGAISLKHMEVKAVVDGELPQDSVEELVSLR